MREKVEKGKDLKERRSAAVGEDIKGVVLCQREVGVGGGGER